MKNVIIAAVVSIVLNAAGVFMVHTKVEPNALFMVGFISTVCVWLSVWLTLISIEDGVKKDVDFWCFCVVMPLMLPFAVWSCILSTIYL